MLLDVGNAMYHLITLSQKITFTCLLAVVAWSPVYAQNSNTSQASNTAQTSNTSDSTTMGDKSPRKKIDTEQQSLDLLSAEIEGEDIKWFEADGEKFLALWQADKTGNPFGAVLILHGEGQSVDEPFEINAIRNNLSLHGWATLSIHLPAVAQIKIPPRSEAKMKKSEDSAKMSSTANDSEMKKSAEPAAMMKKENTSQTTPEDKSSSRLTAAITFLQAQGQYNIVMVGHGTGAARTMKFINDLSLENPGSTINTGKIQRPIRAVVLVSARNQIPLMTETLDTFFNDPSLPILDIYYGEHYLDEIETRQRAKAARAKGLQNYYQMKVMRPTNTDESSENRLTRRIRGFLNKHAKGVEIERK